MTIHHRIRATAFALALAALGTTGHAHTPVPSTDTRFGVLAELAGHCWKETTHRGGDLVCITFDSARQRVDILALRDGYMAGRAIVMTSLDGRMMEAYMAAPTTGGYRYESYHFHADANGTVNWSARTPYYQHSCQEPGRLALRRTGDDSFEVAQYVHDHCGGDRRERVTSLRTFVRTQIRPGADGLPAQTATRADTREPTP